MESSSVKPPSGQYARSGSSVPLYCATEWEALRGSLALVATDTDGPGPDGGPDTLGTAPDGAPDAAPDVAGTGYAPPVLAPAAVLAICRQAQKSTKIFRLLFSSFLFIVNFAST